MNDILLSTLIQVSGLIILLLVPIRFFYYRMHLEDDSKYEYGIKMSKLITYIQIFLFVLMTILFAIYSFRVCI